MLHNPGYDFSDNYLVLDATYWSRRVERYLPPRTPIKNADPLALAQGVTTGALPVREAAPTPGANTGCRTLMAGRRMPNFGYREPDADCWMPDADGWMSDADNWTPDADG